METYLNLFKWIVAGIIIGGLIFVLIPKPLPVNPENVTNTTILQNATPPPAQVVAPPVAKKSVDIVLIEAPGCDKCNQLSNLLLQQSVAQLSNSTNVSVGNVGSLDSTSDAAKTLISRYDIQYLPSLIISDSSGFSQKAISTWTTNVGSVENDGAMVQRKVYPPYYVIANSTLAGFVKGIAIGAANCTKCMNASNYMDPLEQSSIISMAFSEKTVLEENSTEAQALIAKYNITELPTVLLSLDVAEYPVYQQIAPLGEEKDGWFILRAVKPPFVDLAHNRTIRGLVSSIQIVNSSCKDCLVINNFSDYIVNSVGIDLVDKQIYEANSTEAQHYIQKYNLTSIPALLFSPELSDYPGIDDLWLKQNSTIEKDGWHVFRAYSTIRGTYQNISG